MERREQRRLSFASVADDYERSRPGYPREAVGWALGAEPKDAIAELDLA